MNWNSPDNKELVKTILALQTEKEVANFLRDLLTEQEIIEFAKRWKTARLLNNKVSYLEIEKQTGLSSTTIARVSQWLNKGMGGYKLMLNRLHHTNPSKK